VHLCIAKNGSAGYKQQWPGQQIEEVCPVNTYITLVSHGSPTSCDQGGQ
jgi:hypothetical protein